MTAPPRPHPLPPRVHRTTTPRPRLGSTPQDEAMPRLLIRVPSRRCRERVRSTSTAGDLIGMGEDYRARSKSVKSVTPAIAEVVAAFVDGGRCARMASGGEKSGKRAGASDTQVSAEGRERSSKRPRPERKGRVDVTPLEIPGGDGESDAERRRRLVRSVTRELEEWCALNATDVVNLPDPDEVISIFYSKEKPNFALQVYINRLVQYIDASESVFYTALLYMTRLQRKHPRMRIDDYNVHRILTTSIVLASKFLEDNVYTNRHYAHAGGMANLEEMNQLETELLHLMEFDLNVSPEMYNMVHFNLSKSDRAQLSPTSVQTL
eukprot:CAMPEP_0198309980 /NCGR_PEP_ID=MMETSP1450-20131203/2186_1 /TAXON_ID=753684 ORGANISM="Madagascaria erythrocladiodes, Strain CCMP3234" /NCGR_SAMPLE_ID=MMETSP1450 /ASSEMBLY_ACC=CAM_ASM_001115 /LENGTH=321 /DNA_ID=CAMNT_0044012765 /DNA_START=284 /DNA_END=1249 /DNA_ORIENTATION=+